MLPKFVLIALLLIVAADCAPLDPNFSQKNRDVWKSKDPHHREKRYWGGYGGYGGWGGGYGGWGGYGGYGGYGGCWGK
ncbi:unnamed protein product [Caenorhabditis bovis]|uniref:Uncharacterized protein n=1 Tax=Caenorhabditis bovis TaxID=2654633 RepID=A0A8S1EIL5_9PELO|nr:unnamed protein product [Caenorhabditis bovis]